MKKIGILCFPDKRQGGIFQYTQTIIDALLLDKSNNYVIITSKHNQDYDFKGAEVIRIDKDFENLLTKINTFLISIFGIKFLVWKHERKLFESFDLIVSPFIILYPHYWLNIPYIITIHDLQEKYFPNFFTLSQKIYRGVTRYLAARRGRHIICESECVRNDITKHLKVPASRISIIQSPPPLMNFNRLYNRQYLDQVKMKYSLPEKYILYPSQFWPHKNHIKLLDAFKIVTQKYDDVHLVLTGGDLSAQPEMLKRGYGAAIIKKIEELNLTKKVHLLGFVDHDDLTGIYLLSEMLVVPTLFESVSLPIYEAFYLGVPVCASNVVALPEQVGDAGLLFDPKNHQDMSIKIIEMIENRTLRKKSIENGAKKMVRLNIENYSKSLVEVINGVS